MKKRHRNWIRAKLPGGLPDDRLLTLGIPDEYGCMDPRLMKLLQRLVPMRLVGTSPREEAATENAPDDFLQQHSGQRRSTTSTST